MSNFTGVTFAQQKVLPSDDAIIRRAVLPDSILHGCDLSYSGSTLTMASGQLLICGRQVRHPSSQNWAVMDATSGYARLLLTVDLTKSSTKESFEQVIDTIEYASALDGFDELEQTNINVSGSRYEVVVCVVSLGTGGITGIVSQMPAIFYSSNIITTLPAIGWAGTGPYSQVIAADVTKYVAPKICLLPDDDEVIREAQTEAWNCIGRAFTGDKTITFICYEDKPGTDIPLQIEVRP